MTNTQTAGMRQQREEPGMSVLATDVHDKKEALEWMEKSQYMVRGEAITPSHLAHVLMQMAAAIPKLTRQGVNGLRAASFILGGLELGQERAALVDAVRSQVELTLTTEVTQTLREVKEDTLEEAKRTSDKLATVAADMANGLAHNGQAPQGASAAAEQIENTVGSVLAHTEEVVRILREEREHREKESSYANAVRGSLPLDYGQTALVAKGNLLHRQVVPRMPRLIS